MGEISYSRASERILLAIFEQGPQQTSQLVKEAGLEETQQVHYRYSNYLGPDEDNLIEKHSEGRGGHAEWELTDAGDAWVEDRYDDIKIPQTEDEAAEVAATAHRIAKSATSTASQTSHDFKKLEERVMGAVGDARDAIDETLDELNEADAEARRAARQEARAEVEELEEEIEAVKSAIEDVNSDHKTLQRNFKQVDRNAASKDRVSDLEDRLDSIEEHLAAQEDRLDTIEETADTFESKVDILKLKVETNQKVIEPLPDRLDEIEEKLGEGLIMNWLRSW